MKTLDRVVLAACATFVALSFWAALAPHGQLPTAAMVAMVLAMSVMLLGHMCARLGWKLMAAFFLVAAAVEWAFEQTNIEFGGFIWGDLRYGDYSVFDVHLGAVPIVVPVTMALILWPTYAAVNLALDGRIVVDPRALTWWQNVWRCVLYGFVHSWMMLMFNEQCEQWGIYSWVGKSAEKSTEDMFLGDPTAPLGWLIYVVITMLVFTLVIVPTLGGALVERVSVRLPAWSDCAAVILLGMLAVQMYLSPVNNATVANVALWTMGFFAAFAGYRLVQEMRSQRATSSTEVSAKGLEITGQR